MIDLGRPTLEEAGKRMNVSRNAVWRLIQAGREKLVRAIIEGKQIIKDRGVAGHKGSTKKTF